MTKKELEQKVIELEERVERLESRCDELFTEILTRCPLKDED